MGRPFFLLARSQKEWDPVFGKEITFLGNFIPVPSTTEGIFLYLCAVIP